MVMIYGMTIIVWMVTSHCRDLNAPVVLDASISMALYKEPVKLFPVEYPINTL